LSLSSPYPSRRPAACFCAYAAKRNADVKKYIIERDLPGIEKLDAEAYRAAAATSNAALAKLAPRVQWLESFVAKDKTFCVYLAEDEGLVHEHARLSGIPASRVTQVHRTIEPMTAEA
jgi:hypothetical protein